MWAKVLGFFFVVTAAYAGGLWFLHRRVAQRREEDRKKAWMLTALVGVSAFCLALVLARTKLIRLPSFVRRAIGGGHHHHHHHDSSTLDKFTRSKNFSTTMFMAFLLVLGGMVGAAAVYNRFYRMSESQRPTGPQQNR